MGRFSKYIAILSVFLVTGFTLTACNSLSQPFHFPSGYTHHGAVYKSPSPPQSGKFSDLQRQYMGPQQAKQFRHAVYDLVEKLTDRAGLPPKSVYVLAANPLTPFYANIDNDLRESLRHFGYQMNADPEDSYIFTYHAEIVDVEGIEPNVDLTLLVYDSFSEDARLLTRQKDHYYIQGADTLYILKPHYNFPVGNE